MDSDSFDALKMASPEIKTERKIAYIFEGFERYVAEGTPFHTEIWDEAEFDQLLKLLDLNTIDGDTVIAYNVENTISNDVRDSEERGDKQLFDGVASMRAALSFIADTQNFWEEEPNDYRATLLVQFDETTLIAIGEDSTDISEGFHIEQSKKYWVAVFDAADIDNYKSWKNWDLAFFDTKKYAAEKDARELEREQAEGVTNLSRLKPGDLVRVTTKRRLLNRYENPGYRTYTQAELDERFIDEYVIAEAGTEPTCEDKDPKFPPVRIAGGATWTNRRQNPVQRQEKAMTPTFGRIYPNQHLMLRVQATNQLIFSDGVIDSIEIISPENTTN